MFSFSFWLGERFWINFSIVICEKKDGVLDSAGVDKIPLPAAGPGQSHAGGPGKLAFYCSKGHRLAYYLFIFSIKFNAAWRIFV